VIRNLSLLIVCLLAGTTLFSQNRELDSLSLVSLYRATNGDSWTDKTNWLATNSLDTWYGVESATTVTVSISLISLTTILRVHFPIRLETLPS
jgi:hypothetical protein